MRFRSILTTTVTIVALMLAFHALGAGDTADAEGSSNPMNFAFVPFISALIVFALAFVILWKTAWPKILGGLEDREDKIRDEITNAEKAREDAEAALAEYQKSLSEARQEAGKIIEQAKIDQQRVAAELKAKTENELNQMRDSAKRDIEHAKKQAVSEIYDHMSSLATDVASKILDKELNVADQQKLVEESLKQLQPVGSA
ncbi:MAG: F0F1 ATP synthase subunit B [Planctomycetota bacterium]|jgi:F-type H+-transporting ATPase subunit b